jgi:thiosulfate/3-mercaptopyruvate sulfurtransferase
MYQTIIEPSKLYEHLYNPEWLIVDCRFSLQNTNQGFVEYQENHIPGAIYVDLNRDLSSPHIPGVTGRHPLPPVSRIIGFFSALGIQEGIQVIAYDAAGGALAAARLWWMLRWLSHDSVAVLNGGWQCWSNEIQLGKSGVEERRPTKFRGIPRPNMYLTADEVDEFRMDPSYCLLDVRSEERYLGLIEPIDPISGHIPGAINFPYTRNLDHNGCFQSAEEIRKDYLKKLGNGHSEKTIFYCGSGVTAAHSILSMEYAGLPGSKLYAGSWSDWITDPNHPVSRT